LRRGGTAISVLKAVMAVSLIRYWRRRTERHRSRRTTSLLRRPAPHRRHPHRSPKRRRFRHRQSGSAPSREGNNESSSPEAILRAHIGIRPAADRCSGRIGDCADSQQQCRSRRRPGRSVRCDIGDAELQDAGVAGQRHRNHARPRAGSSRTAIHSEFAGSGPVQLQCAVSALRRQPNSGGEPARSPRLGEPAVRHADPGLCRCQP
jgi:hypothetical protein